MKKELFSHCQESQVFSLPHPGSLHFPPTIYHDFLGPPLHSWGFRLLLDECSIHLYQDHLSQQQPISKDGKGNSQKHQESTVNMSLKPIPGTSMGTSPLTAMPAAQAMPTALQVAVLPTSWLDSKCVSCPGISPCRQGPHRWWVPPPAQLQNCSNASQCYFA